MKEEGFLRDPVSSFGEGNRRTVDWITRKLGLEVQFGECPTTSDSLFSNHKGQIECGIVIVAAGNLTKLMPPGVSNFERLMTVLNHCGAADVDIPLLVFGIELTAFDVWAMQSKRASYENNPEAMYASGEVDRP